jgi:hypothetical protein
MCACLYVFKKNAGGIKLCMEKGVLFCLFSVTCTDWGSSTPLKALNLEASYLVGTLEAFLVITLSLLMKSRLAFVGSINGRLNFCRFGMD